MVSSDLFLFNNSNLFSLLYDFNYLIKILSKQNLQETYKQFIVIWVQVFQLNRNYFLTDLFGPEMGS